MIRFIFVVLLFSFVSSDTLPPINRCDSPGGRAINTTINNSKAMGGKYILKRGKEVGIDIELEVFEDVQKVIASAEGKIGPAVLPYPISDPNGCTSLSCPLKKGGPYKYSTKMKVQPFFPPIPVDVIWKLKDQKGYILACVIIPVRIE
ncbi:NPC intracellular cholesterol transporter 2 homolog a-like [Leptopilina boulardi]|uniref:NPC intracellular cholesterol transporter 2 homolog a-like n=1 Tax=Leptopilina boulardi TaxID=63433 RepID=UPI0021F64093|nr:NPC intracellular cholesterol transporter 2 homolog a-like [Leptopilina boulardi]